ncbi:MAG: transcriptional regulator [Bacteroidota bacterium]
MKIASPEQSDTLNETLPEVRVAELQKLSSLFEISIDEIVNFEGDIPQGVTLTDKTGNEQIKLFNQLDEENKKAVFHIIDKMLTQKKFREFFQENIG